MSVENHDRRNGDLGDREVETHKLVFDGGRELRIAFDHPRIGGGGQLVELVLIDSADRVIARHTTDRDVLINATVPSAGTYYLQVKDADLGSTPLGAYSIDITDIYDKATVYDGGANNTSASALPVPLGSSIVGSFHSLDSDYFSIQVDTGGVLRLPFTFPSNPNSNMPVRIQVTDAQGNSASLIRRDMSGDATLETTLHAGGKYYIKAESPFSASSTADLYRIVTSFIGQKNVVYDGHLNDKSSTALNLPLGTTAMGIFETREVDFYTFQANEAGKLSINFLHPEGVGTSGKGLEVSIFDAANVLVGKKQVYGNQMLDFDLKAGGAYYVKLDYSWYAPLQGKYTFMAGLANASGTTIVLPKDGDYVGTNGNDVVLGSNGRDIQVGLGSLNQYHIAVSPGGTVLRDQTGVQGTDTLFNVERLRFTDKMVAIDMDGKAGQLFMLYDAAFGRSPDETGMGFWLHRLDRGDVTVHSAAWGFIQSDEFINRFGKDLPNRKYVELVYRNVLDREPDTGGIDYWLGLLEQGKADRAHVLTGISNSDENIAKMIGLTEHGVVYQEWLG